MVAILRWMRIGEMAETIGCGLEWDIGKPEANRQVLGRWTPGASPAGLPRGGTEATLAE